MRWVGVLVAFALVLDLPAAAQTPAGNGSATAKKHVSGARDSKSPLLADCNETVIMPSPLSPRPPLRRATYSARPTRPHHRHIRPKRHAAHKHVARHAGHQSAHHRRRPTARRPADRRAVLHRVTYVSPLCAKRSEAINQMLGLPGYYVTQPPIAADSGPDVLPTFVDLPPIIGPGPIAGGGGGPTGPGPIIVFPGGPIFPPGPGPIIVGPPGPPVGPPVSPPVTPPIISSAPEPSSWAMMLFGMMLVGGAARRRAVRKAT
jgi:hypothetical protein